MTNFHSIALAIFVLSTSVLAKTGDEAELNARKLSLVRNSLSAASATIPAFDKGIDGIGNMVREAAGDKSESVIGGRQNRGQLARNFLSGRAATKSEKSDKKAKKSKSSPKSSKSVKDSKKKDKKSKKEKGTSAPTTSPAPTGTPTQAPTSAPTTSPAPTTPPTQSPTANPASPTDAPTLSPTETFAPTTTAAPSNTFAPTFTPTNTFAPTATFSPSTFFPTTTYEPTGDSPSDDNLRVEIVSEDVVAGRAESQWTNGGSDGGRKKGRPKRNGRGSGRIRGPTRKDDNRVPAASNDLDGRVEEPVEEGGDSDRVVDRIGSPSRNETRVEDVALGLLD